MLKDADKENRKNGLIIVIDKLTIAFFVFLFFFLNGCITEEIKECRQYVDVQKMECIRHYAIIKQDPEKCYQIKDMGLREECFLKSTNQKEAEKLIEGIEFSKRIAEEQKKKQDEEKIQVLTSLDEQVKKCIEQTLKTRDSCLFEIARANEEITICDEIYEETQKRQCITNIAVKKKNPSECQKLKVEMDRQLCLFYVG